MSTSVPPGHVLLTLDDVRRLKGERDEVAREHALLGQRLELLNKQVDALALFLPAHIHDRVFDIQPEEQRPRKWAPAIMRFLEDAGYGLTTSDIKERLKGTDLEHEIGPYGNALYNALSKMVAKGDLVKSGIYYCLPGQNPPVGGVKPISSSQIEADVTEVLFKNGGGLKSGEIVQYILRNNMPSANGMKKSSGGFYKALSLLVAAGKVVKDGRLYMLPPKSNEPSDAGTSDGSDAGSDDGRPRTLRLV